MRQAKGKNTVGVQGILRLTTANLIFSAIILIFLHYSIGDLDRSKIVAPACAFVFLEVVIICIQRRLPLKHQYRNFLPAHLLMFLETVFLSMDLAGYFNPVELQIFLRFPLLLIQFMMTQNLLRIVEAGYDCPRHLPLDILSINSDQILYTVALATVGSILQFILYGKHQYCDIMIICLALLLVVVLMEFSFVHGLWKTVSENIPHL